MRGLLTMMLASVAAGMIAGGVYVAWVVDPSVWSACAIILSSSGGASMVIRSAAHYRNAAHPKPPDQRQVTTHTYISGADRDIVPYDHWR